MQSLPIPESQLATWSNQGAITAATNTYNSLNNALRTSLQSVDFELYLQGSYRNRTNIRADSDIDVVAQLKSFIYNQSELPINERSLYSKTFQDATYTLPQFRSDVLGALQSYYGSSSVSIGNKSLKVASESGRLGADIVVCLGYRRYQSFSGAQTPFVEGIAFWTTRENRLIVNYPKVHYENGVTKNSNTHDWFKPIVRLFKNARRHLVEANTIRDDLAPSYFLECMLYNVPNSSFGTSYQDAFCAAVNWLNKADLTKLTCQNEQLPLFGGTSEQWSTQSACAMLREFANLWNNWR
jgi:hypothetical protein